jgi:Ni,Fe-hydrogenase I cytochrome b subunit
MYGNVFGIVAWIFFTYLYVSLYYNDFNTGIIDYFQFPFKIMDSLSNNDLTLNKHIPMEMWLSMLFIVVISAVHYLLGRYIGRFISANFHKKLFFKS